MNRKLTYSDYAAIPDDGKRYELLEGGLYVTPAPSMAHQHASRELFLQIHGFFHARNMGEVYYAPTDVILTPYDVVQPDLLVVARREQISRRGIEGAPLLAVEILSPSTRDHDRRRKMKRYAELEVAHYWIADPDARRLECYRSDGAWYVLVASGEGRARLAHPDWTGLTVDLAPLWR